LKLYENVIYTKLSDFTVDATLIKKILRLCKTVIFHIHAGALVFILGKQKQLQIWKEVVHTKLPSQGTAK